MKVLLQRVSHAQVKVEGASVGAIKNGILLFVGIEKNDPHNTLVRMADKVLAYRIFNDNAGKMNLSVADIGGGVLAISQFTLAAQTRKGLRPGFSDAAPPERAERLYLEFIGLLQQRHPNIECGIFGAHMEVSLLNDGPVTFMLEL